MLRECHNVAQVEGEPPRRWFNDEAFDLLVWFEPTGAKPIGFELIYTGTEGNRGLTSRPSGTVAHTTIDDGELGPLRYNMARLHETDGRFPVEVLLPKFMERSMAISPDIVRMVAARMRDAAAIPQPRTDHG